MEGIGNTVTLGVASASETRECADVAYPRKLAELDAARVLQNVW